MGGQGKAKGGAEGDKVHRRASWLNANVFTANPIDDDAIAAMQGLGVGRAMEIFKDIEEKGDGIKNPSGYLKTAARREGVTTQGSQGTGKGNGKASGHGGDLDKVMRRAGWLNENVFGNSPIDGEAIAAMQGLGVPRAMELFKEIEEKSGQVKNPSGYLKTAARNEGFGPPVEPAKGGGGGKGGKNGAHYEGGGKGGRGGSDKISRRAQWLNTNVFVDNPIDDNAIQAMQRLDVGRAMEMFKDVEEKSDTIKNPGAYLKTAVRNEEPGSAIAIASPHQGKGKGKGWGQDDYGMDKVHKRAEWLNRNVFSHNPIDTSAIAAMQGMGVTRAMQLFKDIEEKGDSIKNPGAYLKTAARKEGFGPPVDQEPYNSSYNSSKGGSKGGSRGHSGSDPTDKVAKRANWLNDNVFPHCPIDEEAVDAMRGLDMGRAMELFKEIEGKAGSIKNPGGYLKTAARRDAEGYVRGVKRGSADGEGPPAKKGRPIG